jgi:hypothetical protein
MNRKAELALNQMSVPYRGRRGEGSLIRYFNNGDECAGVAPNEFVSVRTDVGSLPPAMVPLPSSCQPDAGPSQSRFSRRLDLGRRWDR